MPTTTAHDGADIYYEVEGDGPTLLFYASPKAPRGPLGIPSRRLTRAFRTALADRYRLVFISYPGSPKPQTLTPDAVTRDLVAVADAVGAERFGWWGYSWGAVIGLQLAAASDRLTALVCGGFPPLHGPYAEMRQLSAHLLGKAERLPVVRLPLPAKLRAGVQQFLTYYEGLQTFDDVAAQARITCPKLCFAGTEDHIKIGGQRVSSIGGLVTEHRAELEAYGWDVHLLPGLNHLKAMHPDVFLPAMTRWLDALPEMSR